MRITLAGIAAAVILALAGCGSSDSAADGATTSAAPKPVTTADAPTTTFARTNGPRLKLVDSDYGTILSNGRGRALYLFTADRGKGSNCSGECASAWPPYVVKSKPMAGPGVAAGKIGVTRRSDGRLQATYAGHPVYFYVSDNEPGEVLCQAASEFGGYWYVIRASGRAVH